ncbi:hypothetical protein X766_26150 [Mesorhizobium sp. LSJC255A00]|nr:hypothetical protein X766_26150 [Mesorhizobium sp. LSJC255A00]
MAALRMAGPMPARQHGQRAQMRFAGSVQHVSAEKPCQRVTQAKAGGSLPHIHNTLNQSSDSESCDAGVLHEDISGPHMLAILAPSGRYPFSKRTIASDRSRFRRHSRGKHRLDGFQLAQIDCVRMAKASSQDVPIRRDQEVASREALIPCRAYEPLPGIAPASARIQRSLL